MFKFNNNHLITGYIKQLLHDFNLPLYRIYTEENQRYFDEHGTEINIIESVLATTNNDKDIVYPAHVRYVPYIKDGKIQIYARKPGETTPKWFWKNEKLYVYGAKELNHTKNLIIKNNVYDSYTHEYLGDYLRFMRDYNHINLMPLYNCFSNKLCNNINLTFKNSKADIVEFNSSDNKYKIYMLPVKFFKQYTIAIDSRLPVEVCCGLYGAYLDERTKSKSIEDVCTCTYQKYASMSFNNPIVYDKLTNDSFRQFIDKSSITELANLEADFKLFIKLPFNNKSSIVVLEGDYAGYNQSILKKDNASNYITLQNKWITNYEFEQSVDIFKPITTLQLLEANTEISYPFADRLVEFLTFNAICEYDSFYTPENIRRLQQILIENKISYDISGAWERKYEPILYDYMMDHKTAQERLIDTLGFVDKDVEAKYKSVHIITEDETHGSLSAPGDRVTIHTLNDINLYEDQEVKHLGR